MGDALASLRFKLLKSEAQSDNPGWVCWNLVWKELGGCCWGNSWGSGYMASNGRSA